jgi:ubiquitin thioesterase protein OTUB1
MPGLLNSIGRQQSASAPAVTVSTLLDSFNDPETSNYIVVYFRLLASAYLRTNAEDFLPFLFS